MPIACAIHNNSYIVSSMAQLREIERPLDVPDRGLVCDLLWSDPDEVSHLYKLFSPLPPKNTGGLFYEVILCSAMQDILGWGESDRGVSYTFGRDIVQEFLETNNLSLICRAHQVSVERE